MSHYYNENDPQMAAWLRELIAARLIPAGDVDERSIEDVCPDDVRGYVQAHWFCGIAGWPHALSLAGFPTSRRIWTGSAPCQPFSEAGEGGGFADERHLWPAWFHLIGVCRPERIAGEQVASKDAELWLDLVQSDLEGIGYTFGAVEVPAASVGAPHRRQRFYWVADADERGLQAGRGGRSGLAQPQGRDRLAQQRGGAGLLGNARKPGLEKRLGHAGVPGGAAGGDAREIVERTGAHAGSVADSSTGGFGEHGDAAGHGQAAHRIPHAQLFGPSGKLADTHGPDGERGLSGLGQGGGAGAGAAHERPEGLRASGDLADAKDAHGRTEREGSWHDLRARPPASGSPDNVADSAGNDERRPRGRAKGTRREQFEDRGHGATGDVAESNSNGRPTGQPSATANGHGGAARSDGGPELVGDTDREPAGRDTGSAHAAQARPRGEERGDDHGPGDAGRGMVVIDRFGRPRRPGPTDGFWRDADWLLCRDGKWRPAQSGTFPLAYGISNALACVFSRQRIVWEEITSYAKTRQTNADEILRVVRAGIQQGTGWEEQSTGVRFQFHAPPLLLALLLGAETARYRTPNESCGKKEGAKIVGRAMRILRSDLGTVCSPCGRKPEEQFPGESPEVMHLLPFVLARHTEAYRSEVLSAHAALNRVGLLRGAGNAIVPQAAAEVIAAWQEITRADLPES